jgi:hypothetical protein
VVFFAALPQACVERAIAYTSHGADYLERKHANVEILENAVKAVEKLCPNFVYWSFQAGGKVQSPLPDALNESTYEFRHTAWNSQTS